MAFSLTPGRRHDPELMDEPGLPITEVADAYRVLEKVNRQFFGGRRPIARELDRFVREVRPAHRPLRVLDVGSGSGDLASFSAEILIAWGYPTTSIVLDRDPTAVLLAKTGLRDVVLGDALRIPIPDASIDVVTAVKFAHHFHGPALQRLVSEMARVASHRVIVLDIRRHWLAYWGFVAWSRVFTQNRLVRNDGPLSVLRGFTGPELLDVANGLDAFSWQVRTYPGFQLALVGTRILPASA
jgi:SAM-dependent methyltransferase